MWRCRCLLTNVVASRILNSAQMSINLVPPFHSIPFHSIPFRSTPFQPISIPHSSEGCETHTFRSLYRCLVPICLSAKRLGMEWNGTERGYWLGVKKDSVRVSVSPACCVLTRAGHKNLHSDNYPISTIMHLFCLLPRSEVKYRV